MTWLWLIDILRRPVRPQIHPLLSKLRRFLATWTEKRQLKQSVPVLMVRPMLCQPLIRKLVSWTSFWLLDHSNSICPALISVISRLNFQGNWMVTLFPQNSPFLTFHCRQRMSVPLMPLVFILSLPAKPDQVPQIPHRLSNQEFEKSTLIFSLFR